MSSSSTPDTGFKPIFTRALLTDIEASLANDGEFIELKNTDGKIFNSKNIYHGRGTGDLAPGTRERRNLVMFQDERNLRRLQAQDKVERFFPVYNGSTLFTGPELTLEESRALFQQVYEDFEQSEEAEAITDLVYANLRGLDIHKVIAFGLGRVDRVLPGRAPQSFYEHVAVKFLWTIIEEVTSASEVALLVQDPLYCTDVCKTVLEENGFDIIPGYGAQGFGLVDDKTVVLTHHPNFPFRSILADLARPALICMKRQAAEVNGSQPRPLNALDLYADADSERSRKMLEEYSECPLTLHDAKVKAFWDNTWYIRNMSKVELDLLGLGRSKFIDSLTFRREDDWA
ncbi:hypothetical protein F4808DRAFT_55388 [Astrocystis sublimbata]|nr:hypothetical protein F4808DRAFT_55388 [Astrocystis sublimbata]